MRSKNAPPKMQILRYNEKAGKSVPVAPKRKIAENLHKIDRRRPKMGLKPNFLGYPSP
jgi:hypothetical protein